jgi:hypothetical protein
MCMGGWEHYSILYDWPDDHSWAADCVHSFFSISKDW